LLEVEQSPINQSVYCILPSSFWTVKHIHHYRYIYFPSFISSNFCFFSLECIITDCLYIL